MTEQWFLELYHIVFPSNTTKTNLKYLLDLGLYPIVRLSKNGSHHVILRYYEIGDPYDCDIIEFFPADKIFINKIFDSDFLNHNVCIVKRDKFND